MLDIRKEIIRLEYSKIQRDSDILTKIAIIDIFTVVTHSAFDSCLKDAIFLSILETANVIPVFKKNNRTNKNKSY